MKQGVKIYLVSVLALLALLGCDRSTQKAPNVNNGEATALESIVEPILIGDVSSYVAGAAFAGPGKVGFQMAIADINAAGGVLGRPLKLISKDDLGAPAEAVRVVGGLFEVEEIVLLTGCNFAHIELAFSNYVKHHKKLFISACTNSDKFIWDEGHRYAFRAGGPPVHAFNKMYAERAALSNKTRWATVNHSYEWGQSNYDAFREHLGAFQPEAKWVDEHWTPIGKLDAGAVVQSMLQANPDAIFTALWGADFTNFLREGRARGLFDGRLVVAYVATNPAFFDQMGKESLAGAIGFGLPPEDLESDALNQLAARYEAQEGHSFRYQGLMGYHTMQMIANAIEAAGTTETEALADILPGFKTQTVMGGVEMRAIDHQATAGTWVGEAGFVDGVPMLVDYEFKDGKDYFPSDEYILNLRKK